jgi:hypothetical protein
MQNLEQIRYVEVDAARLMMILNRFSLPIDDRTRKLKCFPSHPAVRYFTPEYKLQKLDFLVRYPTYFAYELVELHRMQISSASNRNEIIAIVNQVLRDKEPELRTIFYQKFLRGAYECIDEVESWWYARRLVYCRFEKRGAARPQKYYFLTEEGEQVTKELVNSLDHATWYDNRIQLIHKFFDIFSAEDLKNLQYSHPPYRDAQLNEEIPDLSMSDLITSFEQVFGEQLEISLL